MAVSSLQTSRRHIITQPCTGNSESSELPIPTNDVWIAFLVLQRSLSLCDRDAHSEAFAQLSCRLVV